MGDPDVVPAILDPLVWKQERMFVQSGPLAQPVMHWDVGPTNIPRSEIFNPKLLADIPVAVSLALACRQQISYIDVGQMRDTAHSVTTTL